MDEDWILVFRAKPHPAGRWERGELISAYPGTHQFRPAVLANARGNFAFVRTTMTREEVEELLEPDIVDNRGQEEVASSRKRKVNLDAMTNAKEREDMADVTKVPTIARARIIANRETPVRSILAPRRG